MEITMKGYILQTLMGGIGSMGFAMLFNIRKGKLLWIALGGTLSWAVYLIFNVIGGNIFIALLCGTSAAALASELLARAVKAPVITLEVPMLIPLIPGGDLYYMMSHLVRSETEQFGHSAQLVMTEAGAIALGIICVASAVNILTSLHSRIQAYRSSRRRI
jgi:uncharacterized membrane protein YjjB (DUF3815 family)